MPLSREGFLNILSAAIGTGAQAVVQLAAGVTKESAPAVLSTIAGASWLGPVGIVLGAVAGHEINRLAARVDRTLEQRAATGALLSNQHLSRALAGAVQQRVKSVASTLQDAGPLVAIANGAPDWWPALVETGTDALRTVDDRAIAERIAEELTGRADRRAPGVDDWRLVLDFAHAHVAGHGDLDPRLASEAARALADHFLHDAVTTLLSDAATSGEAFGSVVLRFLSAELFAIRELAGKVDESLAVTRELKEAMRAGAQASRLLGCDDLQPLFDRQLQYLDARLDALSKQIDDVGADVQSIAARIDSRATDITGNLERLEQTVRRTIRPASHSAAATAAAALVLVVVVAGALAYRASSQARALDRDYRRLGWVVLHASGRPDDADSVRVRAELWLAASGVTFSDVTLTTVAQQADGRMTRAAHASLPSGAAGPVVFVDFSLPRETTRVTACLAITNAGRRVRSRVTQTFALPALTEQMVPVSLTPLADPTVGSDAEGACTPNS